MAWLELRLHTDSTGSEELEEVLLANGALAITLTDAGDQPILEPGVGEMPLWPETIMVGLFENHVDTEEVQQRIEYQYQRELGNPRWEILEDQLWERQWLKFHKPVKFGERFWVYHEKIDSDLPTLLLDPGLAFGTGSHPTTALCLDWVSRQSWEGKQLIDYGCGSGILSIAAALMGCNQVTCTDIDPLALTATRDNAYKNNIPKKQLELFLAGQEPTLKKNALVANILAGPLIALAPAFAEKLEAGGDLCLSGILASQENEILSTYSEWFEEMEVSEQNGWLCITGRRKTD